MFPEILGIQSSKRRAVAELARRSVEIRFTPVKMPFRGSSVEGCIVCVVTFNVAQRGLSRDFGQLEIGGRLTPLRLGHFPIGRALDFINHVEHHGDVVVEIEREEAVRDIEVRLGPSAR